MPPKNQKLDVKLRFQKMFEIGIILAILFSILAFRFFPEIKYEKLPPEPEKKYVEIIDVIRTDLKQKPPIPPKPVIPIIEELEEDDLPDITFETTDLADLENLGDVMPEFIEDESETTLPFRVVENMPEIIGGLSALQHRVSYPEIAIKAGIQGKVILETIIGKDGIPEEIKVLKGIGAGCDESAIEAVLKTKFKPGTQRGKPVRVILVIPIAFTLNN